MLCTFFPLRDYWILLRWLWRSALAFCVFVHENRWLLWTAMETKEIGGGTICDAKVRESSENVFSIVKIYLLLALVCVYLSTPLFVDHYLRAANATSVLSFFYENILACYRLAECAPVLSAGIFLCFRRNKNFHYIYFACKKKDLV